MAEEWYVGRGGQQSGPFAPAQLRQMAASGQLAPGDLVWKEGLPNWVAASSIKGLFPPSGPSAMPAASRPAPRPTAAPPRASRSSEADVPGGDLDGNATTISRLPDSVSGIQPPGGPPDLAEFLPRVGATLLDGLFLGLLGCVFSVPGAALVFGVNANDPQNADAVALMVNVCVNIVSIVVGIVYYVTLDASAKQGTWGKQIVGLKVTDLDGRRISVGRALGRCIARYLSACTCGIGFLLPLFTEKKQTLHDLICGCLVVKK